jgi:hypothetical protein
MKIVSGTPVSLDPGMIGLIVAAALVLLDVERRGTT